MRSASVVASSRTDGHFLVHSQCAGIGRQRPLRQGGCIDPRRALQSEYAYSFSRHRHWEPQMARLIRFTLAIVIIAIVGGLAMWALGTFVEPTQREIVIPIPLEEFEAIGGG